MTLPCQVTNFELSSHPSPARLTPYPTPHPQPPSLTPYPSRLLDRQKLPVAQWLERQTDVREVMNSIPVGE